MRWRALVAPGFAWAVLGCAPAPMPPMRQQSQTRLQTREFQTRAYETTDTKLIMKALVNVLQDDGFIVGTANGEIGLITAMKENTQRHWFLIFANDITSSWSCSVNVTPFGQQTKVRVNVQLREKWWPNGNERVAKVDDPAYYQTFFSKVDKGIFIQKERL